MNLLNCLPCFRTTEPPVVPVAPPKAESGLFQGIGAFFATVGHGISSTVHGVSSDISRRMCNATSMGIDVLSGTAKTAQWFTGLGGSFLAAAMIYDTVALASGNTTRFHTNSCADLQKRPIPMFFNFILHNRPDSFCNSKVVEEAKAFELAQLFLIPVTMVTTVVATHALGRISATLDQWNRQFFRKEEVVTNRA